MNKTKLHESRNLRHGSVATAVTVLLIAAIVLLNVITTALQSKYGLYTDLSNEETFTLSDAFKEAVSNIDSEITITFCHEPDYLEATSTTMYVYRTALQIAEAFPNVSVRAISINKEPTLFSKYMLTSASNIATTSVIVESGTEFRILGINSFYVADDDGTVWAYNGEEKFAANMLSVTSTSLPVAYFTENHGETKSAALEQLVVDAGYEVKYIDLTKDEIDPEARLIIINNPIYDFQGGNAKDTVISELEVIDNFVASNYASVLCFVDPLNLSNLANLQEYLFEWGVKFEDTVVRDKMNAITTDGYSIVGQYVEDGNLGSSLVSTISGTDSPPKTIFKRVAPIAIADIYSPTMTADESGMNMYPTGSYSYSGNNAMREISYVFRASEDAVALKNGEVTDGKGSYGIMTITQEIRTVNNEQFTSYVLCAATSSFTDEDLINSYSYANREIIYAAFKQMGKEFVPASIKFKVFQNYDIEDMTTNEANTWSVVLVTVLPLIFLAVGAVVVIRRRYR